MLYLSANIFPTNSFRSAGFVFCRDLIFCFLMSKNVMALTKYTPELADKICELISTTDRGLRSICNELKLHHTTVLKWLRNDEHEGFINQYARAREDQADFLASQIIEIADDSSQDLDRIDDFGNRIENKEFVNRSKIRIDARKWVASKAAPKKYGDKMDLGVTINKLGKDLENETYE